MFGIQRPPSLLSCKKNNQNTRVPPSERSVVSPSARISRPGTIMYCCIPGFAYKIIWASILPQTDLCHSEDSFTSPSLSLHWSLLNFSPSAPAPRDVIFSLNVQHLHWLLEMGRAMPLLNKFVASAFLLCFFFAWRLAPQVRSSRVGTAILPSLLLNP